MGDGTEAVLAAVGPRLRAVRLARDITLSALAGTTGISVSTLSRLESGQRRPNLELLLPLAKAYHVPLDELVGAPATGDPRVHLRPIVARGMTIIPLTRKPGGIQAYKHILQAGPLDQPNPQAHQGYEWLYVLNGKLRMVLGSQDLVLKAGEAAEFDTRVPHSLSAAGSRPAQVISIFNQAGVRMHTHGGDDRA